MSRLLPPLIFAARVAAAQPAAPDCAGHDRTACGRLHFEKGTQLFQRADFAAAAAEFQAALAQRAHPVIRFNLALSLARLGRARAALEQLRLVRADPTTDKQLRERAEREQRRSEQTLARVMIRLADPGRERVELDGVPIAVPVPDELALDPGNHRVRVVSGNAVVLDQELDLAPGERVELHVGERSRRIDVVVVSDAPASPAGGPRPAHPGHARQGLSPAWFYSGLGTTAALAGLAVWSGLDTRNAFDHYQRDLPRLTQAEADERVRDGHNRELRTNLLLAGSLVCAASSAVLGLWLVDFSGRQQAAVGLSLGGVALAGRF